LGKGKALLGMAGQLLLAASLSDGRTQLMKVTITGFDASAFAEQWGEAAKSKKRMLSQ